MGTGALEPLISLFIAPQRLRGGARKGTVKNYAQISLQILAEQG